eukprot:TRINITY_DN3240_c0_g1_i1.p1 TRINITY_DN3240_c0_g1~~TRINITY_DN3240_c0_g1_i1.p1  ORF type:complete len:248 (-),score=55.19 TRINITY_DN3240_c0_g1_i1:71-814(-)
MTTMTTSCAVCGARDADKMAQTPLTPHNMLQMIPYSEPLDFSSPYGAAAAADTVDLDSSDPWSSAVVVSGEPRPPTSITLSSSPTWQFATPQPTTAVLRESSEPPVWLLMPIGGRGINDATPRFLSLLHECSRISIVQASRDAAPLELLTTIDSSSGSFGPACRYLESHAHNFSSLNLGMRYNADSTADRQLVARVAGVPGAQPGSASLCLWPTAMAFNRLSNELVVLVTSDRSAFPWEKVAGYFGT